MLLDVNLPFNLFVTAKTSAPEQFERPSFCNNNNNNIYLYQKEKIKVKSHESHVEGLGA